MAKDPSERYPSAGDLGQAALVAAGGLRRARRWSVVATGEAAPLPHQQTPEPLPAAPAPPVPEGVQAGRPAAPWPPEPEAGQAGRPSVLRWAVALAALAIVAVGMVAALRGISAL